MKPLVPTRGTGKPLVLLIAMAGVPRVLVLAGGRRPLLPVEAAEIVCSFLHLRPTRAFNVVPQMFDDLRGCSLHFLLEELYRVIYIDPSFDRDGRVVSGHLSVRYAIAAMQSIGVGTEWGRALLQSVFRAPGVASTWVFEWDDVFGHQVLQSVVDSPGFAWTAFVSPQHRLRHLLREAMHHLGRYMLDPPHRVGVNYIELDADLAHLEDILGVEFGEGWVSENEDEEPEFDHEFDNDDDYLRDQQERRLELMS
jgi:hypothetical protein